MVLPKDAVARLGDGQTFERYVEPMPFVVEVWSPSTGTYDIDRKIPGYLARGDLEIWRIHPFDRTVHIWRRQTDGSYVESLHRDGPITLAALPQVTIELEPLFVSE
jgi:Uma2 family endonuclease